MDTLRTILIILGILLVVGIYLADRIKRRRIRRQQSWNEDEFGVSNDDIEGISLYRDELPDEWVGKAVRLTAKRNESLGDEQLEGLKGLGTRQEDVVPERQANSPPSSTGTTPPAQKEEVIILTLMAVNDQPFRGPHLLKVLQDTGLQHGEMGIFHYLPEGGKEPLFSVANILEPGYFELAEIAALQTPGVMLFMRLPTIVAGKLALETLLHSARNMAAELGGQLCDAQRKPLDDASLTALQNKANTFNPIPL